jgi:hypothetical protein
MHPYLPRIIPPTLLHASFLHQLVKEGLTEEEFNKLKAQGKQADGYDFPDYLECDPEQGYVRAPIQFNSIQFRLLPKSNDLADLAPNQNTPASLFRRWKASRIRIFSCVRPHMRAFHFAWSSFFFAFLGWFALAPLMPVGHATYPEP